MRTLDVPSEALTGMVRFQYSMHQNLVHIVEGHVLTPPDDPKEGRRFKWPA